MKFVKSISVFHLFYSVNLLLSDKIKVIKNDSLQTFLIVTVFDTSDFLLSYILDQIHSLIS